MASRRRNPKGKQPSGMVPCIRCGGDGVITQFGHIQRGVCFECGGTGWGHPRAPRKRVEEPERPVMWWWDKKTPSKRVHLLGEPWRIIKGPVAGSMFGRRAVQHDEYAAVPEDVWGIDSYVPVSFEIVRGRVKIEQTSSGSMLERLGVAVDEYNYSHGAWERKFAQIERALQALFDAANRRR